MRQLLAWQRPRDCTASFTAAIAPLTEAGLGTEVEQILAASRAPTRSSLAITGAIGVAILRVQASVGHLLPRAATRPLNRCLRQIRHAWPGLELDPSSGDG